MKFCGQISIIPRVYEPQVIELKVEQEVKCHDGCIFYFSGCNYVSHTIYKRRLKLEFQASLLKTKAARNPKTTISPAKSWACSKASGIMVSVIIAKIAPAAIAVVAAMISCEK